MNIFDNGLDCIVTREISLNPSIVPLSRPKLDLLRMLDDAFLKPGLGESHFEDFLARSTATGLISTLEVPGCPVVSNFDVFISYFFGDSFLTDIFYRISRKIYCNRCWPYFRF
jgi:hypothetical protein